MLWQDLYWFPPCPHQCPPLRTLQGIGVKTLSSVSSNGNIQAPTYCLHLRGGFNCAYLVTRLIYALLASPVIQVCFIVVTKALLVSLEVSLKSLLPRIFLSLVAPLPESWYLGAAFCVLVLWYEGNHLRDYSICNRAKEVVT